MVSSFATKAAKKATSNSQEYRYRPSNVVSSSDNKENQQQLDKVVESVANATKRLSQASTTTTNSSKRKSQNHVGPWRLGRTLGRGSTGRVRLAKHSITGQLAAVKIVPKLTPEKQQSNNKKSKNNIKIDKNGLPYGIEREIIIMKVISHPNIMALYDVWENKNELYLVLEYIEGGELFDYLVRKGKLEEKEAVTYFKQIISGLQYCHKFNICHRDLKPENLLLDKNRKIKIADFGMATLETNASLLETSCGSPHYASPEIVAGKNYHGGPSDIWSAGIILFALLTGHLPFDDPNIRELLLKVQAGKFRMPSTLSPEAKDLIWKMLKVDPKQRISIDEILKHPLINKYTKRNASNNNNDFTRINSLDLSPVYQYNEEILRNLQTLWHGIDINVLKSKLSSTEKNSEKIFYQLLKNHLNDHQKNMNKPAANIELKKPIPRSTSIVTTTVTDENGENVKTIVRQVPNISTGPQSQSTTTTTTTNSTRKALGSVNSNILNTLPANKKTRTIESKKPVISASSSYRKPKSFKQHKKSPSISRSSSKKSLKIPPLTLNGGKLPSSQPPLPKVAESKLDVMDFMYLCDEIFGKDDIITTDLGAAADDDDKQEEANKAALKKLDDLKRKNSIKQKQLLQQEEAQQQRLLAEKQLKAKEELKQLENLKAREREEFISNYPKPRIINSSLDPSRKPSNGKTGNANDVLLNFGVRLSRFGNLRDLNLNQDIQRRQVSHISHFSGRSSLIESKSVSTRDLTSYLKDESKKNITIEEFNKYKETSQLTVPTIRTHQVKPSEDLSFDFSINEAQRMPISPVDKFTFNEPKYYSLDRSENSKRDSIVEDRYLDADTSASSLDDDQDLIRIVNAFSQADNDKDIVKKINSNNSATNKYMENKESFIVHHRKADSRDEYSSLNPSPKIGQPMSGPDIRSSLFSVKDQNIPRDNTTQELNARFNLTPDKKQKYTNLKNLIIDNELLLKKQEQQGNNKFLRLSIYEDPEDTMTTEENIQELDHDSIEQISISNDIIDMNHYESKQLPTRFVTEPVNESAKFTSKKSEAKIGNVVNEEDLSRKKSVKFKNFFKGANNNNHNMESKESRKKFLKPVRQAPRAPSYNTANVYQDENKRGNSSKKPNNKGTKKPSKKSGVFFKKLLHIFEMDH